MFEAKHIALVGAPVAAGCSGPAHEASRVETVHPIHVECDARASVAHQAGSLIATSRKEGVRALLSLSSPRPVVGDCSEAAYTQAIRTEVSENNPISGMSQVALQSGNSQTHATRSRTVFSMATPVDGLYLRRGTQQ